MAAVPQFRTPARTRQRSVIDFLNALQRHFGGTPVGRAGPSVRAFWDTVPAGLNPSRDRVAVGGTRHWPMASVCRMADHATPSIYSPGSRSLGTHFP